MSYKGKYKSSYPQKYKGDPTNIIYRSLWESKFMVYCDKNDNIPLIASTLPNLKIYSNLWFWVVLAGIPITIVAINLVFKYRRKSDTTPISPSKKELSLQDFKRAILDGNLLTVEAIAENFETNAVQLNRIFKSFGTTPGKFLKQVKLEKAEELISKGIPLEEVSMMIGYSQPLLKKELARK